MSNLNGENLTVIRPPSYLLLCMRPSQVEGFFFTANCTRPLVSDIWQQSRSYNLTGHTSSSTWSVVFHSLSVKQQIVTTSLLLPACP